MHLVKQLAIVAITEEYHVIAHSLAQKLNLPLIQHQTEAAEFQLLLCVDENGIGLKPVNSSQRAVTVDFTAGAADHRRRFGGGKNQAIAKAIGVKSTFKPFVLDATAGLGGDSFVLASLGCRVIMVERSAIIAALLQDGMQRARRCQQQDIANIIERLSFQEGNSCEWLKSDETEIPDVVYIDPMFPHRDKTAKVKKEMQVFQQLIGESEDVKEILAAALLKAKYRVVVKRPRLAPENIDFTPSYQLKGKSSRFDIYVIKSMGK